MKKTLIALAVGSAFAASAAYADVTISGSINAGPAFVSQKSGSNGASNSIVGALTPGSNFTVGTNNIVTTNGGGGTGSNWGINTNYSNITIGSLEDLGGGLKLDFAYQLTANFQSATNSATNRNSHIGLVGDSWGGVWWGTNEMLYESYYYTVDPLDGAAGMGGNLQMMGTPGFGNVFDSANNPSSCVNANGGVGCADFYRRDSNAIWYNSPNFNGFTGGVYATLPAYKSNANPTTGVSGVNPKLWGLGGKYVGTSLPIQAWAAYEQHSDMFGGAAVNPLLGWNGNGAGGVSTGSSDKGFQFGLGYTFGDVFIFANFERLQYKSDATIGGAAGQFEYKRNAFGFGGKWNLATGYVGGQFIKANSGDCSIPGTGCSATDTGGYMLGLGYYHTMSKQTQAYVMGTWNHNDSLQYYTTAGGVGAPLSYGSNLWGFTVGLKHSF